MEVMFSIIKNGQELTRKLLKNTGICLPRNDEIVIIDSDRYVVRMVKHNLNTMRITISLEQIS
jgi:hypothetical protein